MKRFLLFILMVVICFSFSIDGKAEKKSKESKKEPDIYKGLKFRSIGPAFTSGRIADFAVNPKNHSEYYVGVACGHVWKTTNAGITFRPVFDNYGSYSIGCLAIDPNNTNVVWVGTGENNSQRALGYGDGVYKTEDGGKSWQNMGLKNSRQIGKILIDHQDSSIVYVAAEGSVWGPGGDRGLYKTTDAGKTWKKILEISNHTGVSDMVMDPRDSRVIYAASHQRRRHVFTKIDGGPETAIYKTTDAGVTWKKLKAGIPKVNMGAIGLAISPADPDIVYALIEAADNEGGFFRSKDRGASWKKMSSYVSASPQYYNEIFADPKNPNKVFSVDTVSKYTVDGGKTWKRIGLENRHVDDHAMWIDPNDTRHYLIGGDGGVYETFDDSLNWSFKSNLPVTQFYRLSVDNDLPFYNVYGGTQDNDSMGGPSQTVSSDGIVNSDWFVTNGGDGFWTQIDPKDPNIVYAESQYGWIVRYDRKSGEGIYIKPQPRKGEDTYKWNWNTPLIISPHSHTRLYCAANKVFRSDDRGNSWTVISEDLTAQIDRNQWPVMGKYWSADAVSKDVSTSLYGTIVSLEESSVKEDLIYVGTDDGLIQVTENAGKQWRKIDSFPGVPKYTYVSDIKCCLFDGNTVYASFDNRKRDDFAPYLLKSTDRGKSWVSISGNLPKAGTVHCIEEDYIKPDLLFAGTEFGIFFSNDGGKKWNQLKGGIPTIAVRDIAIQQRENDLVLATFGRGFYILDNYTPLREINPGILKKESYIFEIKDALMFMQSRSRYGQGATYFKAKNPEFGATFTYYLKEAYQTQKQIRHKKEKKLFEKGEKISVLSWEELREESKEEPPYLLFTISDSEGNVIREIRKKPLKGINRVTWDLRYPSTDPVELKKEKYDPLTEVKSGMLVMPGKYRVSLSKSINGVISELYAPKEFNTKVLKNTTLSAQNRRTLVEFQKKVAELTRVVQGTLKFSDELNRKIAFMKQSIQSTPGITKDMLSKARKIESKLDKIIFTLRGYRAKASREEIPPTHPPILSRLRYIIWAHYRSTSEPTQTQRDSYNIIKKEMEPLLKALKKIAMQDIKELEQEMEKAGSPWTPGRIPQWQE